MLLPGAHPPEFVVSRLAWDYALRNRPVHSSWAECSFPFPWEVGTYPANRTWNRIIRQYYRAIHTNPQIPHDAFFCEYPVTCGEVAIHSIRRKHMVRQRRVYREHSPKPVKKRKN